MVRGFAQEYDKDVIRRYRGMQSERHPDIEVYKKQLLFRASHMGQKELELIVHHWLKTHMSQLDYAGLIKFEEEVMLCDNIVLFNYILGSKPLSDLHPDHIIRKIKDFAFHQTPHKIITI